MKASTSSLGRRSLSTSMSTMEATGAADVLADLDELDSVMGVETQDQQDLKPKQVHLVLNPDYDTIAVGGGWFSDILSFLTRYTESYVTTSARLALETCVHCAIGRARACVCVGLGMRVLYDVLRCFIQSEC